ncbi:MAG: nucleotide exchange factor GrpE [Candidatus Harrisonbacteria bacterium CG10_big_fil_rev_8_21_14_0_10_44_23]|uniref:Protein GrpE n=1 Tax=Candidatus Harrisonbacteria bacterium CG10_big_fil_rev_8_21_14_0_10_44_23 TaxID=1974585 RepID=A0A2H0UPX8_9BACT|nr:MAG: nucleotide exchange factor GrpE [Candidatus Harrisonbacteria bacterium CG10_big_fil_rev_8_21_14_0_10_44_23]
MKKEKKNKPAEDLLGSVRAEKDEYLAGWQRAKADLINYRNEEAERFDKVRKFALEDLIMEMLIVLDSFAIAIQSAKEEADRQGMEMIKSQLVDVLRRRGLEIIETKVGDEFNPEIHEAIEEVAGEDSDSGKIIEITSVGYRLNGKIIKATKVKVGK